MLAWFKKVALPAAALAAAVSSAVVVVLAGSQLASSSPTAASAAPACAGPILGRDAASAGRVADAFIRTAVLRRRPVCSFDLVTPRFRQGLTQAEWASGDIPVQPFLTHYPDRLRTDTTPGVNLPRERSTWVALAAEDAPAALFELVVVLRKDRWLVDYWGPAVVAPALASATSF